jgi:hypothetical protein
MQPYKRPDPTHNSLWLIEELDAKDKHKLITMIQAITRLKSFRGKGQVTIPYGAIDRPIEHDTVLIEFDDIPTEDMNMEFEIASHIIFERGVVGDPHNTYGVIRCLEEVYANIEKVIDYFDELIALNPYLIPT